MNFNGKCVAPSCISNSGLNPDCNTTTTYCKDNGYVSVKGVCGCPEYNKEYLG